MPERIQETEIQITQKDKDRIINEIKKFANFKSFANGLEMANDSDAEQFGTSEKVFSFKYPEFIQEKIIQQSITFLLDYLDLFMTTQTHLNTIELKAKSNTINS